MIGLFDCHCDTITRVCREGGQLKKNAFHIDLERLRRFTPCVQVFAVCTELEHNSAPEAAKELRMLRNEFDRNKGTVKLCLCSDDIGEAAKNGLLAALISVEGAEQIPDPEAAYAAGVRIIHPTWNYDNIYCGAALGSGKGLSEKGKELVRWAQEKGVALDLSHISERGFWDVMEIARRPVIAGHSDAGALCDNPRNLTNDQFTALVKLGGGAGINLYPEFLGLTRDIDAAIAHMEHFLSLGGERSVFLGCDFDGIEITPAGLSQVTDLEKLYEALLRKNYSEVLVNDIFFNNAYEIMRKML